MFYRVVIVLAHILMSILFDLRFEGLEHIPEEGGFILAANHRSYLDPVFCAIRVKRKFNFMAKEELFNNKIFGAFIRALGAFPVARGTGDTGAITEAERRIREGGALMIFPEGTRSKDGIPLRPRSGVALIAGQTGADVVPCTIDSGKKLRFRTTVTIKYHPVMTTEQLAIDPSSPRTMRTASRAIMDEIVSGLTYYPQQTEEPKK